MPVVSKIRFLMFFSFARMSRTLLACEAAPQPEMPETSIFQSFSTLLACLPSVASVCCAAAGRAKASAASSTPDLIRMFGLLMGFSGVRREPGPSGRSIVICGAPAKYPHGEVARLGDDG